MFDLLNRCRALQPGRWLLNFLSTLLLYWLLGIWLEWPAWTTVILAISINVSIHHGLAFTVKVNITLR